jgi:hypothetical protein
LAEAGRQLRLARHAEEVIATELGRAQSILTIAGMHRDEAIKAVVTSHKAVATLRDAYAEALVKAAELRLAMSALNFYLPPHTLPNDADFHSESMVSLRAPKIQTDGSVAAEWHAALRALESDANVTLPGE